MASVRRRTVPEFDSDLDSFFPLLASPIPTHEHHSHADGICAVTGVSHAFCPPQPNDVRSPCPALNVLANHGYLPRDGRNIGPLKIYHALRQGYHLSTSLAFILAFGGWIIFKLLRGMSVKMSTLNHVHDTALFHRDGNPDEHTPIAVSQFPLQQAGRYVLGRITLEDIANIRAKREATLQRPTSVLEAEITRGGMALVLGVLGGKNVVERGADLEMLRCWVTSERLPDDWKPGHTQGLFKVHFMTKIIRDRMKAIKEGLVPNILDDEPRR